MYIMLKESAWTQALAEATAVMRVMARLGSRQDSEARHTYSIVMDRQGRISAIHRWGIEDTGARKGGMSCIRSGKHIPAMPVTGAGFTFV